MRLTLASAAAGLIRTAKCVSAHHRHRNQHFGFTQTETPTSSAYADVGSKASADPGVNYARDYQAASLYQVAKRSWFTEQPDLSSRIWALTCMNVLLLLEWEVKIL